MPSEPCNLQQLLVHALVAVLASGAMGPPYPAGASEVQNSLASIPAKCCCGTLWTMLRQRLLFPANQCSSKQRGRRAYPADHEPDRLAKDADGATFARCRGTGSPLPQ